MGLMTDRTSPKLEPEVYKTRKDENFTEYFKKGLPKPGLGDGNHNDHH